MTSIVKRGLLFGFLLVSFVGQSQDLFFTINAPDPGSDNMAVCDTADIFTISIANISGSTMTSIAVYPQLPAGLTYVAGTLVNIGTINASESDISNLNLPIFSIPILSDGESSIFTIKILADCNAIPLATGGTAINFDVTAEYTTDTSSGMQTNTSSDFEITKPVLNVLSISPSVLGAYLGGSFDRVITLTNGGFGPLDSFVYYTAFNSAAFAIDSLRLITSGGDVTLPVTYSMDGDTIFTTIYPADILAGASNGAGNAPNRFERNEILEIREHLTITNCSEDPNARHTATWGCFGDFCESQFTPSGVVYDLLFPDMAYGNGNTDFSLPNFKTCWDEALPRYYRWVNEGSAPATNIRMQLHTIWSEETRLDTAAIRYQLGMNGSPQRLDFETVYTRNTVGNCFGTATHIFAVDVLVDINLEVGDTLYIYTEQQTCCDNSVCGNWEETQGLYIYNRTYMDACEQFSYNDGNDGRWAYKREYLNGITETPTDIPTDDPEFSSFSVTGFETGGNNLMNTPETCNGCYYEFLYIMGAGIDYANDPNDLTQFAWRSPQDSIWHPDEIIYNDKNMLPGVGTEDTLIVRFYGPRPTNFNFLGSQFVFDIEKDCDNEVPLCTQMQNAQLINEFYYIADPTNCSDCRLRMDNCPYINNSTVHCPTCGDCFGIIYQDFDAQRWNLGFPDNDNDGNCDAEGTVMDTSLVRRNRLMQGDTLEIIAKATISTTEGEPMAADTLPFFDYVYLSLNWTDPDYTPAGAIVTINDDNTGIEYNCNVSSLQFKEGNHIITDISAPSLRLVGCPVPLAWSYEDRDSITLSVLNKVSDNIGGAVVETDVENSFFASDIPWQSTDRRFACNYIRDRFTLLGSLLSKGGGHDRIFNGCQQRDPLSENWIRTGNALYGNFFPFEFRPFFYPDKTYVKLLDGYILNYIRLEYGKIQPMYPSGSEGGAFIIQLDDPALTFSGDTLIVDEGAIFRRNDLKFDEAYYSNVRTYYDPTCDIPQGEQVFSYWGHSFSYEAGRFDQNDTTVWSIDPSYAVFNAPELSIVGLPAEVESLSKNVSWLVQVVNGSQNIANNSFLYVEEPSGQLLVDSVYAVSFNIGDGSITPQSKLASSNDIYQLGNLNSGETRYFQVFATMNNCHPDSLNIQVGWDCLGYPNTIGDYICQLESATLRAIPQPAELQMQVINQPTDPVEMCSQVTYEVELSSGGKGYLYDMNFRFSLPNGYTVVPNSFELKYPIDNPNGYELAINQPSNVFGNWWQIDVSELNNTLENEGFQGATDFTSNFNRAHVRFQIESNCPATSGRRLRFFSWADNACGRFNNYVFSAGNQLRLNTVNPPYESSITAVANPLNPCLYDTSHIVVNMITGFGALTGSNDSIEILLPIGHEYFPNSYIPLENAVPGEPTITISNGQPAIRFPIQSNLGQLTPINFKLAVRIIEPMLECGENNQLQISSYQPASVFCPTAGTNCGVRSTTGETAFNITTVKPEVSFIDMEASAAVSQSAPYQDSIFIKTTIRNSGETVPPDSILTFNFYSDLDDNGLVSAGDQLIGSFNFDAGIPFAGEVMFRDTLVTTGGVACGIVVEIDPDESCVCEYISFNAKDIPLNTIRQDLEVCSNTPTLLPVQSFPGYTYQWSAIGIAPITALSPTNIANPIFTYENITGSNQTFQYQMTTLRENCVSSDTISITVFPYQNTTGQQFVCLGTAYNLNGPIGFSNYNWTPNTGLTDPSDPLTDVAPLAAGISYTLTFDDTNGCPGQYIETVLEDPNCIDLELSKSVSPTCPYNVGDAVTWTIAVTNNGPGDATNLIVADTLPPNLNFVFSNATHGFYNSIDGLWNVGTLPNGETATLNIDVTIADCGSFLNQAFIKSMDQLDFDSELGNDNATEDDFDWAWISTVETCNYCFGDRALELPAGFQSYQWRRNGIDIPGATDPIYFANTAGAYDAVGLDGRGNPYTLCPVNLTSTLATLGDFVWEDTNQNGVQDIGENGLAGVLVQLYTPDGTLVAETNTDANGAYLFSDTSDPNQTWYAPETAFKIKTDYYLVVGNGQIAQDVLYLGTNSYRESPANATIDTQDSDGMLINTSPMAAFNGAVGVFLNFDNPGICTTADFDFGFYPIAFDWGDLPDFAFGQGVNDYETDAANDGPRHQILPNLRLGIENDAELDGQQEATAEGDDGDGNDDEDGFTLPSIWNWDSTYIIPFAVVNTTGSTAYLEGWIDWNADGDFDDANEKLVDLDDASGSFPANFSVTVPRNAVLNQNMGIRFRLSLEDNLTPYGQVFSGEVEDYIFQVTPTFDWGDLPDLANGTAAIDYETTAANNGPVHMIIPDLYFGTLVDSEINGQTSTIADGDDNNGQDDEDGFELPLQWFLDSTYVLPITATNATAGTAYIEGWVDWNGDGDFDDPNEMVLDDRDLFGVFPANFTIRVPANAQTSQNLGMRFRISHTDNMTPYGLINSGEVEDYMFQITPIFDWGDLPDSGAGVATNNYQTTNADGGAYHEIIPNLSIGSHVDVDADGFPSSDAEGDDNNGIDDEEGLILPNQWMLDSIYIIPLTIENGTGETAHFEGWIDWNGDGDFNDANERVVDLNDSGGSFPVDFDVRVPAFATVNQILGARFRLSQTDNMSSVGLVNSGEVEDYVLQITPIYDWGDLADSSLGTGDNDYQTLSANGGAVHLIYPGLRLGSLIDDETDGIPSTNSAGDDNDNVDDEDGIALPNIWYLDSTYTIPISILNANTNTAHFEGWIDWNNDGDFDDSGEMIIDLDDSGGSFPANFMVTVPDEAVVSESLGVRFRLGLNDNMSPNGAQNAGEVEDYLIQITPIYDWGDLPDLTNGTAMGDYETTNANNGPVHQIIPNLFIGGAPDDEVDGQASTNADGDDNNGNDEDGIALPSLIEAGTTINIPINLTNGYSTTAHFEAWMDWNGNGEFDTGEMVANLDDASGAFPVSISISVPVTATINQDLGARFRLSQTDNMTPYGATNSGEVEDYIYQVTAYDWGDLPDTANGTSMGNYETTAANNGPNHQIVVGLHLGSHVDQETDGQNTTLASGDDADGNDDEDGLSLPVDIEAGTTISIPLTYTNTTGLTAYLRGWIDWNGNGEFDAMEMVTDLNDSSSSFPTNLNINVPMDALINENLGVRFRISHTADLTPYGTAMSGEVEDYILTSEAFDYGDLPDLVAGTTQGEYETQMTNNGPRHMIIDGLYMGGSVDRESDGHQSIVGNGDDNSNNDDEDVTIFPDLIFPFQNFDIPISITNTTGSTAHLEVWIDWDGDGTFDDVDEMVADLDDTSGSFPAILSLLSPPTTALNTPIGVRFRLSLMDNMTPYGEVSSGEVEDYIIEVGGFDFGDLPDLTNGTSKGNYETTEANNGPRHLVIPGFQLGNAVGEDEDGQPSANANGDDNDGDDDEDGIIFPTTLLLGRTVKFDLIAFNPTGMTAHLEAWADWNADGDFDDLGEMIIDIDDTGGFPDSLEIYLPNTAVYDEFIGFRFRLSNDDNMTPYGEILSGEIEDYWVELTAQFDHGDLPDNKAGNSAGNYQTTEADDGPGHLIIPGLFLGLNIDNEPAGQPDSTATGDGIDEDALTFPSTLNLVPNVTIRRPFEVNNTTGITAYLRGWIDFNGDGDFDDPGELITDLADNGFGDFGQSIISFRIPNDVAHDQLLGVRFRLSHEANMLPTGLVRSGEVEDYLISIGCKPQVCLPVTIDIQRN